MKIKCFWCKGKSKAGVHSKCWKVFSGWMLSDRPLSEVFQIEDESADEYVPNGQTYKTNSGRYVIQGKVMPNHEHE